MQRTRISTIAQATQGLASVVNQKVREPCLPNQAGPGCKGGEPDVVSCYLEKWEVDSAGRRQSWRNSSDLGIAKHSVMPDLGFAQFQTEPTAVGPLA